MPWKRCYYCGGYSYSAATFYDHWICPHCHKDLTGSPECDRPLRVIPGRGEAAGAGERPAVPVNSARPAGRVVSMSRRTASRPRRLRLI